MDNLPSEILDSIFAWLEPSDLAYVAQTCRRIHSVLYDGDEFVWRAVFLLVFDTPSTSTYGWRAELRRRMSAKQTFISESRRSSSSPSVLNSATREDAFQALLDTVLSAAPCDTYYPHSTASRNIDWVQAILSQTNSNRLALWPNDLYIDAEEAIESFIPRADVSALELSLNAKLSLLRGVSPRDEGDLRLNIYGARSQLIRARKRVFWWPREKFREGWYDVPLTEDGDVDWVLLRDVVVVLTHLLEEDPVDVPRGLNSVRAHGAQGLGERTEDDWAGITGRWKHAMAFWMFDADSEEDVDREDQFESRGENMSSFDADLHYVTSDPDAPESKYDTTRPLLHFEGVTVSDVFPPFPVKGTVCTTPKGEIRWSLLPAMPHDDTQLQSVGVQIGGVSSAVGFAGLWSRRDQNSVVFGPFWSWKISGPLDAQSL